MEQCVWELYPCTIKEGTIAERIYKRLEISERHRHRYELNPAYFDKLQKGGLVISGTSPNHKLAEMIELSEHPYFVACQFHPDLSHNLLMPIPCSFPLLKQLFCIKMDSQRPT